MQILILGGTAQLGRAVGSAAVRAGHDVTALARGKSGEVPEGVRHVVGDRDTGGLGAVRGTTWDAVIEVASQPGRVRQAVAEVEARHWVYVSSVNVYASVDGATDESAALVEPLEADSMSGPEEYGAAKVACERAVLDGVGSDRVLVVRPGLIGGPEDGTDRSSYWPYRMSHPVERRVLMPDAVSQPVQLLDVRDLAEWLVVCMEQGVTGVVDAVGEETTLGEVLAESAALANEVPEPVVVDAQWLAEQGVNPWMGPRSLPLWLPGEMAGMMRRSGVAARELGLRHRPLRDTLRAALADAQRRGDRPWAAGLEWKDERDLIARARESGRRR
ncbi:NAD-dependent epimerase/dehydratase family protein [Ornithinimicrobium sp. Y1847]|uniref:NAD-dependent epimerase/dehydratase family protein n=1 Tax=Ornithinimicrobium sp. Y1847 TaxID=3405419 RepID=UPI003B6736B9